MDKRSLVFAASVALSIALSLIPVTAQPKGAQLVDERSTQKSHPENDQDQSQAIPAAETPVTVAPASQDNPAPKPDPAKSYFERFCDWLWRWTEPQIFSSLLLFVVGTAGVVIGLRTLYSIHKQTRIAVRALKINKRTADAAQRSATLAENALHSTERAQVGVPYTEWTIETRTDVAEAEPRRFWISYKTTNFGRTNGMISYHAVFGTIRPPGPEGRPPPMEFNTKDSDWDGEAIIGPGQSIPRAHRPLLTEEELWQLWNGESAYWVQGRVVYRDVFDKAHYTNFTARAWLPTRTFSFVLEKGYADGN